MKKVTNCHPLGLLLASIMAMSICNLPASGGVNTINLAKYIPETPNSKQLKNSVKVLLTNMKLRRVPLPQKRSERHLAELYNEEVALVQDIEELEKTLNQVNLNMKRLADRKTELLQKSTPGSPKSPERSKAKVSQLTESRIEKWQFDLEGRKRELEEVRAGIREAKAVIKDPENYISIPVNYGKNAEAVRERERALLIRDRENMQLRHDISSRQIQPTWITDNW